MSDPSFSEQGEHGPPGAPDAGEHRPAAFGLLADAVPAMLWSASAEGSGEAFSAAWLAFTGGTIQSERGEGWCRHVHPEDRGRCLAAFARARRNQEAFEVTFRMRRHDGEYRWILDRGAPRFDPAGRLVAFAGACVDVTERFHDRDVLELAFDAGRTGAFSWDRDSNVVTWDARLEVLFGLEPGTFGGRFEDWYELLHPDDREGALAVVEQATRGGGRYRFDHRVVLPDGSIRWLEGRGEAIVENGRVVGTRGISIDITDRKNTELLLHEVQHRLSVLGRATEALGASLDVETALGGLAHLLVPGVVDMCEIALLSPTGVPERVVVVGGSTEQVAARRHAPVPLIPEHPYARVIREARTLSIDIDRQPELFGPPDVPTTAAAMGLTTAIIAPIRQDDRVVGVLSLGQGPSGRVLGAADEEFVTELAGRAASTIERCALYERERLTATQLQQALLPDAVPAVPGVDIAVRYRPGTVGVQVGGDWYDVIEDRGDVWVAVGDVMGAGVEAAGLMGRVRSMVRALTIDERSPGRALGRLERALGDLPGEPFATVVLARFDRSERNLSIALAGHPPVLFVRPDGSTEQLGRPQPPVMSGPLHTYRDERHHVLPGSVLVFYTDGLIERPGESIDVGLARLARAASEVRRGAAESIADAMLLSLADGAGGDDIALVVVRVT